MGRMNELDLCIQEVALDDKALRDKITDELVLHLNGLLPYNEMSQGAQRAISIFETAKMDELSYHEGHLGFPVDDDDLPLDGENV